MFYSTGLVFFFLPFFAVCFERFSLVLGMICVYRLFTHMHLSSLNQISRLHGITLVHTWIFVYFQQFSTPNTTQLYMKSIFCMFTHLSGLNTHNFCWMVEYCVKIDRLYGWLFSLLYKHYNFCCCCCCLIYHKKKHFFCCPLLFLCKLLP